MSARTRRRTTVCAAASLAVLLLVAAGLVGRAPSAEAAGSGAAGKEPRTASVVQIQYREAGEVAVTLSRFIAEVGRPVRGDPDRAPALAEVRVIDDPATNKLLIYAAPAERQVVMAIIAELDVRLGAK